MRVSGEEIMRISRMQAETRAPLFGERTFQEESVVSALESRDIQMITEALSREPDTREQVIASLRERIESGTYQVSGEQIAEMMVRRALADRIR